MNRKLLQPGFFLVIGVLLVILGFGTLMAQAAEKPSWCGAVRELLTKRCTVCHNRDNPQGGIDLTCYRTVCRNAESPVQAGNTENGTLVEVLTIPENRDEGPDHTDLLDDAEMDLLKSWIAAGCPLRGAGD